MSHRPTRILFPYVGDTIGGSHFSSILLVQELVKQEAYEPVVALHDVGGPLAPWLKDKGITPIHIPLSRFVTGNPRQPIRQLFFWLYITPYLALKLRHLNIDIVHTHDLRMHFSWLWAARLAGKKHIWHKRNQRKDSRAWGLIMRQASFVLNVSKYTMGRLNKWIPKDRISVADNPFTPPPPIDSAEAKSRLYKEMGWPLEDRLIITVGTVSRFKRTDIFLKTGSEIIKRSDIPCRFVVLGRTDGQDKQLEADIKNLGIEHCTCIAGFRNDVQDWIAAADMLVSPSENEPLGRSIIESMMMGTPVIVSDSGGNREILTQPRLGKIVALDDHIAFADSAIDWLKSPELAEQTAREAQQYALGRFRVEAHVDAVTKVYKRLMTQ